MHRAAILTNNCFLCSLGGFILHNDKQTNKQQKHTELS